MAISIIYESIGIIHTPFYNISGMPIQPSGASEYSGTIELKPEYKDGLKDIEGFSHIILLYHLHKVTDFKLLVIPFMDKVEHGIFATRSPRRPNPIGISTVQLEKVEDCILFIKGVDMLNDTPLLDIKPFYQTFDNRENTRSGWLMEKTEIDIQKIKSDDRFAEKKI
jgi:tRNA (adenine37-N6)-methyltransferase